MPAKESAALGLTLSQSKSTVVASHPRLLRAVRCELLEHCMSFESANSVRDGLNATAEQRGSVTTLRKKKERKCSKRGVRIKIIQIGLKHEHETKRSLNTVISLARGNGTLPKTRMLTGLTQEQTKVRSSAKCNRVCPVKSGNRRHSTTTARCGKRGWT